MYSNKDFELGLAYRIGQKIAYDEYLEKEASMQAVKAFGSGLKGVVTGSGKTVGDAFRAGTQGLKNTKFQGKGFRDTVGEIGKGLADPWKNMYSRFADNRQANRLYSAFKEAPTGSQARKDAYRAIKEFGGVDSMQQARRLSNVLPQQGELGTLAVGALGATAAGMGAYNVGKSALGYNQQPQVAPHQYYANQMRNWWNG